MQPNAAVCARDGPDKSFMESIRWFEFAPVRHRIAGIWFANAALGLVLVVNGKVAGGRFGAGFADVPLDGHEQAIAFHDVEILGREREFYYHVRRVMWTIRRDVIIPPA